MRWIHELHEQLNIDGTKATLGKARHPLTDMADRPVLSSHASPPQPTTNPILLCRALNLEYRIE